MLFYAVGDSSVTVTKYFCKLIASLDLTNHCYSYHMSVAVECAESIDMLQCIKRCNTQLFRTCSHSITKQELV